MNKLFTLHAGATYIDSSRPYYSGTWEPFLISTYVGTNMPPFQYTRTNTQYFYCGQIINSVETDITDKFRSGTELITDWTLNDGTIVHTGRNISDYHPNVDNTNCASDTFVLTTGNILNFRIEAVLTKDSTSTITIQIVKGSTVHHSYVMHTGKNEIAYKIAENGTYFIRLTNQNDGTLHFHSGVISCQLCLYDIHNDFLTYYGESLYSGITNGLCRFTFQSTTKFYSDECLASNDLTFINSHIKISVSSLVDYAGIYYKGLFIQSIYRLANVRRSPEPHITVTGEERNGIVVQEKMVTATKYKIVMKCNEALLDALTTAMAATLTVVDQSGKTFTMNNCEIEKPSWYNTNGLVTITFDDNINVYTENSSDL
jgi:hypothetical protein